MVEWQHVEQIQNIFECRDHCRTIITSLSEHCSRSSVVTIVLLENINLCSVRCDDAVNINKFYSEARKSLVLNLSQRYATSIPYFWEFKNIFPFIVDSY